MAPSKAVSWEESRRLCKGTGIHLVFIESIEELHFLEKIIRTMQTTEYFIGLQKQSGEWRWISNYRKESTSKGYLQWATREPSGNGNCSEMYLNTEKHLWYDDLRCDRRKERVGYICERAVKCNDEKESTAKPVTPPAKASGKLQSTNPTTVQATSVKSVIHSTSSIKRQYSKEFTVRPATFQKTPDGKEHRPTTVPTFPGTSKMHSTLPTQNQPSKELLTTVEIRATQPENILHDSPAEKPTKSNSYLILVILLLLAVIILVILTTFWVFFVRRHRSRKIKVNSLFCCPTKNASSLSQQTANHENHLETSIRPTVHLSMLQPEESMDTYETVNEESQEHTYAVVEKSNRKSRRRQRDSSTEEQGIAMQMLSDEGYLIPTEHPVTTIAAEE